MEKHTAILKYTEGFGGGGERGIGCPDNTDRNQDSGGAQNKAAEAAEAEKLLDLEAFIRATRNNGPQVTHKQAFKDQLGQIRQAKHQC